jgi:hypothetical protein
MRWVVSKSAMPNFKPEFTSEIVKQVAAMSAILGGFAASFFGILLQSSESRRHVTWAAAAAAVASAAFIVAVIAGTLLSLVLNPDAPQGFALPEFTPWASRVLITTFAVGIYSNLFSLGLSGWIRSRTLGIVTSVAALIAAGIISTFVHWR